MPGIEDAPREVMNAHAPIAAKPALKRTHPMVIVAAGAVTLFCAVGIGVMTGIIPSAHSLNRESNQVPVAPTTPLAVGAAQAPLGNAPIDVAELPAKADAPAKALALQPIDKPTLGQPLSRAERVDTPRSTPKPPTSVATKSPAAVPTPTYVSSANPSSASNGTGSLPAQPFPVGAASTAAPAVAVCHNCGTIESILPVTQEGKGSGAGAILGGVLGGVLGHQVGSGRGKDAATVAGAVGGAVLGNQIEKSGKSATIYEIRVRLNDGTTQTVRSETNQEVRVGDKVKIENGKLVRG